MLWIKTLHVACTVWRLYLFVFFQCRFKTHGGMPWSFVTLICVAIEQLTFGSWFMAYTTMTLIGSRRRLETRGLINPDSLNYSHSCPLCSHQSSHANFLSFSILVFFQVPSCFLLFFIFVQIVCLSPVLSYSFWLTILNQAWVNGDNMFWGDKQAQAAAEGSLGKAMDFSAAACVAIWEPDKSPAVGSRECLHHIAFRDM